MSDTNAPADVAKRLKALVPQCDDPSDYTSDEQDILAAAALITKLEKLVKTAFDEGFQEGKDGGWIVGPDIPWKSSDARAELNNANR